MAKLPAHLQAAIESAWHEAIEKNNGADNAKLSQQLDKAKHILRDKTRKIAQLEALLKTSAIEQERELNNAQQHIQGLEMALEQLRQYNSELSEQLLDAQTAGVELQNRVDSLTSLSQETAKFDDQKRLMMAELDNRGTLLATLQIETRRLADNLNQQQQDNDSLEKGNVMLQSRNTQLTEKFDDMADTLKSQTVSLADKDKHIEILERQLRLAEQNVEHLESLNQRQQVS